MKARQMFAVGSAVGAGLMSAMSITSAALPPGQGHSSDATEMTGSARDAVSPAQRPSSGRRLGGLLSRLRERLMHLSGIGRVTGWSPEATTRAPSLLSTSLDALETQVMFVRGDLSDWRAVQRLHSHCETLVQPGRQRVVLNLASVDHADTKLVASLVALARRAQSAQVPFEIRPSSRLSHWIALCRVEQFLDLRTWAGVAMNDQESQKGDGTLPRVTDTDPSRRPAAADRA